MRTCEGNSPLLSSSSSSQWLCMNANLNIVRQYGDFTPVERKLREIFGADFHDILVLNGGQLSASRLVLPEDYIFVNCSNYSCYKDDLKHCREIITVLESYDNPISIDESEIVKFKSATEDFIRGRGLEAGDVVIVESGHFQNLKGIVLGAYCPGHYSVLFKLFTRTITRVLAAEHLRYEQSIFDRIKFPVVQASIGQKLMPAMNSVSPKARDAYWRTFSIESQLYRPWNRESE